MKECPITPVLPIYAHMHESTRINKHREFMPIIVVEFVQVYVAVNSRAPPELAAYAREDQKRERTRTSIVSGIPAFSSLHGDEDLGGRG